MSTLKFLTEFGKRCRQFRWGLMIVLATNVASEAMKPDPHPADRAWLNVQVALTLFLPSVALAGLMFGIATLPAGKRKDMPSETFDGLLGLFRDRVLPFDTDAASWCAEMAVKARTDDQGFPTPDGYIAATAASPGFIVASRGTPPFLTAEVSIINPLQP